MIRRNTFYSLLLILFGSSSTRASHIVGGEMFYQCLGDNNYQITLKVYRDCYNGQAPFDNPANLFIYNDSNVLTDVLSIAFTTSDTFQNNLASACASAIGICEEVATYTGTINLDDPEASYTIVYQRCCRSLLDVNILDPTNIGSSIVATIPSSDIVTCNSSPHFNNNPPGIICVTQPFSYDFSATDPDGDSLVYVLCAPNDGANSLDPQPYPPYPYSEITFASPYSAQNPMGGNPPLSIDAATGLITVTPDAIGTYGVGICVSEYRNGIFLSGHKGDYIFNVYDCGNLVFASLPEAYFTCDDFEINFANNSVADSFHWDFGVAGVSSDTSNEAQPIYTYADTGTYLVMIVAYAGDSNGSCFDTAYTTVYVYPSNLNVNFTPETGVAGQSIHFMDLSTTDYGTIQSWSWSFGNGAQSLSQNPYYAYPSAGTYQVSLVVSTNYGCTAATIKEVIIEAPTGISSTDVENKIEKVVLIDLLGQERPISNLHFDNEKYFFDQTQLPAGIYILEIYSAAGVTSKKIVVQH